MSMTESELIDRINGARCYECQDRLDEVAVKDAIDDSGVVDLDEVGDVLYEAKSCNCDATMAPMIYSDVPIFDDPDVDDDYRIRGQNGQPDRWEYEADWELLERVS